MVECLVPIVIGFILFIISITFIIMTINLTNTVNSNDLVNLYEINDKENESLSVITTIRKSDGTGCNISRIYDENGDKTTQSGSACK